MIIYSILKKLVNPVERRSHRALTFIGSSRAMHDVCLRISPVCKLKRMDQKLPPYSLAVVLFDLIQLKLKPRNIE